MDKRTNIDLNLLAYLQALVSECHVSRAAQRMNLSQPAMSLALKKLRVVFNDRLLVPSASGMVPTKRALELVDPLQTILNQSHDLFRPSGLFEPANCIEKFTILCSSALAATFLPSLSSRFNREAPGASLTISTASHFYQKEWFDDQSIDLGVAYSAKLPDTPFHLQVSQDPLVCIARRDHPEISGELTLEVMCRTPFVRISANTSGITRSVDQALEAQGKHLRVGVQVADYSVIPAVVSRTDYLAVAPQRLVEGKLQQMGLQMLAVPLTLSPIRLALTWPERTHAQASRRWLRQILLEALQ